MNKRQFILDTLLPYRNDPSLCSIDKKTGYCLYLSEEGKTCAVGKHMKAGKWQKAIMGVEELVVNYSISDIFTVDAEEQNLTIFEWYYIQNYHDSIATGASIIQLNELLARFEKETNLLFPELYL